jgi:enamine deaminase RidA (YjgF/YER057c/UK114 family)
MPASGRRGSNFPAGRQADGSPETVVEKQVQLAFDNLAAVLKAAGCTFDDVVDVTTFHTDPATQWEAVTAVRLRAFHRGMKDTVYVKSKKATILYRWAENQLDRLAGLADLASRRVAVIAAGNTPSALAAKVVTTMIPTVSLSAPT